MPRYVEGRDRQQVTLLPECLEDFIAEDNPVRVIDAFVDELDLTVAGFEGMVPAATGRPAYHPGVLLKIYIYGYLNRVQSSRRLERECQRNVELMWLTGRLAPDFKTIADFRRDNGRGIRQACSQFVAICRRLKLLVDGVVAVDGSKFKAVNNRDRNFTPHKLEQRMKQIQESIDRYLEALDTADRTQPVDLPVRTERLQDKLGKLRRQMNELREVERQLQRQPDQQLSLTDPDARSMATSGRGTGIVGYNVQIATDTTHHFIVAHEVLNVGHDRTALASMARKAQEGLGRKGIGLIADRGYYKGTEILAAEKSGVQTYIPKPMTSGSKSQGRFSKADFVFDAKADVYRCPAGQILRRGPDRIDGDGMVLHSYVRYGCSDCPMKAQCTPASFRRIRRWEHEDVLDDMQHRLDRNPNAMKIRRRTVEHVFGTLKYWMGSTHFLMKTSKHVPTEVSLHVLAYNLKRLMSLLGIAETMKGMRFARA
jgi:transposase